MTRLTEAEREARAMSETQLRLAILKRAKELGYRRSHIRWDFKSRTVAKGDPGFPDLVLARGASYLKLPRLIIAELKRETEEPYDVQEAWLDVFRDFARISPLVVCVWRPSQWFSGEIERMLAA